MKFLFLVFHCLTTLISSPEFGVEDNPKTLTGMEGVTKSSSLIIFIH